MGTNGRLPERAGLARHRQLVELATDTARRDERVQAAWLVGSLAADYADEFSDIDFHIAVRREHFAEFGDGGWAEFITRFTPTVATRGFGSGMGGYAITPDWMHFDLAVHRVGDDFLRPGAGIRPLFDRYGDLLPSEPVTQRIERGSPYFPADVVQWFFYMLGNLAVVVGRDEPVLGMKCRHALLHVSRSPDARRAVTRSLSAGVAAREPRSSPGGSPGHPQGTSLPTR
jgi:hypothetical protein